MTSPGVDRGMSAKVGTFPPGMTADVPVSAGTIPATTHQHYASDDAGNLTWVLECQGCYEAGRAAGREEGRAAERQRIRQLATERDAKWQPTAICDTNCTRAPHPYPVGSPVPFADLLDGDDD